MIDLQMASIKAEAPGSYRHDLERAACDRDVLEKVDRLILLGEVIVKAPFSSEIRLVGSRDRGLIPVREVAQPAFGADMFLPKA